MTAHAAPKDELDRTCSACGKLKAGERFPRGAAGQRLSVCETCQAARAAPRPCVRCAALVLPNDFPWRPSGRRSSFCEACYTAAQPKRRCPRCGKQKTVDEFFRYVTGQLSRACLACRRPLGAGKRCRRCKELKPPTEFHAYPNRCRAASCNACRRARPHGPTGVVVSPHPCAACGGRIAFDEPPSHIAKRRTCSPACAKEHRRRRPRTCLRCKRSLPWHAFDGNASRGRKQSCRACADGSIDFGRPDLARRPSPHQLRVNLRGLAERERKGFNLRTRDIQALHRSPCVMCGKAVSAVVLKDAAGHVTKENCQGLCRLCRRLLRLAPMAEIVLHANEVAAYRPLDPDRLGGCVRCQCTKSSRSKSSARTTSSDGA